MTKMTLRRPLPYAAGLGLALALAACGGSGAGAPVTTASTPTSPSETASSSSSSSPSPTTPAGRTLSVEVTGRTVTPAPSTVVLQVGATLRLTVTSDRDDRLHVHGFEVERELPAGVPVTIELVGTTPGVYEVETHHRELRLMKIAVR